VGTDKGLGPEPSPHPYLPGLAAAPAGYRTGVVGAGPLADGVRHHSDAAQISQGHRVGQSPVPGVDPFDSPAHLGEQPAMQPVHAATLTLSVPEAHRGNSLYQNASGGQPTVTLQQMRADHASSGFSQDVSASPAGAGGLAGAAYRAEPGTARTNPELDAFQTPEGAPGAVHPLERLPGELQRPGGDVGAPGSTWSTRAPGDDPGPAGGYVTRR
jgi:hypothetical protein